jgi:glycosyltransferase involved in cell wall biosynthesis
MKKVSVISHDASLTGAPVLLTNLMRILKETGKYEFVILLRKGGELQNEFTELGRTFVWNKNQLSTGRNFLRVLTVRRFKTKELQRKSAIIKEVQSADVILNNTITNGDLLSIIGKEYTGKIITYVHELTWAISTFTTDEAAKETIVWSNKFIVPSIIVKRNLEQTFQVPKERITLLNYFIDPITNLAGSTKTENTSILTVGGCGTSNWRKGFDVFISVAIYLKAIGKIQKFLFTWKGVSPNISGFSENIFDIEKAGLKEKILLLPSDKETDSFYKSIDVFFLSSREDPYPLVVLEAATYNVPTVCFKEGGGAPEFVQSDAGFAVPYLDIQAIANVLLKYEEDRELLLSHAKAAKNRVKVLHQDKSMIIKQFEELIEY